MSTLHILAIGDVVGPSALDCVASGLSALRDECRADLVIVNAENASEGNGLDAASAKRLLSSGADVLTTGNHVWKKRDLLPLLSDSERILRPANYPAACPGFGYTVYSAMGYRFLVINVLGNIYMDTALESPFAVIDRILAREEGRYDFAILDIHAEATSEKLALARCFDGRIHVVFGTHTHVPTADLQILPRGTGYITDLGMTGPENSILGVQSDIIIEKLRTQMPVRFQIAAGDIILGGACFALDTASGRIVGTEQITRRFRAR